jgi:RHH-type transcriptional regulator, proline utilization regulon repressor / proline dehydrogenase / delta 1-pyrroline-5-carboxylate dehydrogenase
MPRGSVLNRKRITHRAVLPTPTSALRLPNPTLPDDFSFADRTVIERTTQEVGRWLFEHLDTRRSTFLHRDWWDDRIMAWAMRDESVKVQMFRFIDVLPMLGTAADVNRHLQEYLGPVRGRLPSTARMGLDVARALRPAGRALAGMARKAATANARRFIAGSNTAEVLAAAERERTKKRAFTLDVLGEAVISEVEAERYLKAYVDLIEGIAPTVNSWPEISRIDRDERGPLPRVNVSVKLSALDSQFDPADREGTTQRVAARLRTLLRVARRNNSHVHIDMESYEAKALTLHIFQTVLAENEFRDWPNAGVVIQCYLRDSGDDLAKLAEWAKARGTPIWVRLVKGAYWDYETVHARSNEWPVPVYQHKAETDANFERQTRFVFRNHHLLRPALGSHNVRSLAHGIAVARFLDLPPTAYEIQMLYGMADPEKQAFVDLGQRMRVYMPYGELIPGMAYLVRRLLENTSNESFLRANFEERLDVDDLLAKPETPESIDPNQRRVGADGTPQAASPEITMNAIQSDSSGGRTLTSMFRNEPLADFAEEGNRRKMRDALGSVRGQLGRKHPLRIEGRAVETSGQIVSNNPSDHAQVVGYAAAAEARHVSDAVAAALRALPAWWALGARRRAEYLFAAAEAMRGRRFELAAWEVFECGKQWREADGDVCEAIDYCEYYAQGAIALDRPHEVNLPGEENRTEYLPRGVVGVIAPWNFPLAILTGMSVAALATGNTVVMKPAEQSPIIAAKLMEIFQEVGLPAGVANYLPGQGETAGAALVEHPDVALIAFTGSRNVGLAINRRAAEVSASSTKQVKRVIVEMGGKNAIIVDDDADLDEAVAGVVKSAFGYQGQKCSACSRAIVLNAVYDQFMARLIEATRSLKVGPAEDPSARVGPVIDAEAFERVRRYVEIGRQEGREALAVDVGSLAERGYFIGPHIFTEVKPDARIAQEEIFGPVLAVIRAADLDDALRIANGVDYALTGGVFSRSPAHLDQVSRAMLVGNLYLNRPITGALVHRQPFGGFKLSGIGDKAGGPDYLLQFVVERTITENTLRRGFAPPAE